MSKPITPDQPRIARTPDEQIKYFVEQYRDAVRPDTLAKIEMRVKELNLQIADSELLILAALDTPAKVQTFLNTQIYYNDDHTVPNVEETAMSPRQILQNALAHCFEGALFAYAVNFLHGHHPHLVLLESSQDADHNLIVVQDPQTGWFGCNAHSAYPNLDGRPAQFRTIRALAESYHPFYYSDWTRNPADLTLVGYSEPIDLVQKFGTAWIDSTQPLWDIYYTYIDSTARFHYLFDDSDTTHTYPLIRALKEHWLVVNDAGQVSIAVDALPREAQNLWHIFWRTFDSQLYPHPRGAALHIEKEFFKRTGTTPLDLRVNADEFQKFLDAGYRIEQLLIGTRIK